MSPSSLADLEMFPLFFSITFKIVCFSTASRFVVSNTVLDGNEADLWKSMIILNQLNTEISPGTL